MAKVEIIESLYEKIEKKFGQEADEIFGLIKSLEENPKKGKSLGFVGNNVIKELRYKSFRFYFITNGYQIRFYEVEKLKDIIIKFIRMSDKKSQQKTIDEIKHILRSLGSEGF